MPEINTLDKNYGIKTHYNWMIDFVTSSYATIQGLTLAEVKAYIETRNRLTEKGRESHTILHKGVPVEHQERL